MAIFKERFYHNLIKKYTMAFGTLFTDIDVARKNSDDSINHTLTVPVTYAPREKFIRRLEEDYANPKKPALTLPRISFEMVSLNYDPQRKLPKMRTFSSKHTKADEESQHAFMPVPYDIVYGVNIVTKTQDEMLQIIEQILPGFTPDINITVRGLTDLETDWDVPISLMDVQPSDTYDGAMADRRQIMWSLTFMLKGYLFGPVGTSKLILTPDIKKFDWSGNDLTGSD